MTARPSQIRAYRILSFLAILHSAAILVLSLRNPDHLGSWWWLGLATSLFIWPVVLAIHPGRSIRRFLLPTIISVALFLPYAPFCGFRIYYSIRQWRTAHHLEKLLRSNPRIILYSIDQDHTKPPEVKKGYRPVGADEIILPDDMFTDSREFSRADEVPNKLLAPVGQTINSVTDETVRARYGKYWLILRKLPNGSNEAAAEIASTPGPDPNEFDREPYKGSLGYAEITDRAEQRALITALASSARDSQGGALCHSPRHGLYVETGTYTIDLSICFECQNVYLFGPDDKMGPLAGVVSFGITRAPESAFNATLKRHGIPISQPSP